MAIRSIILSAFGPGEVLTNKQICIRTGRPLRNVAAWVAYLRHSGHLQRCQPEIKHRKDTVAHMKTESAITADEVVSKAVASQPTSVFDVARRMGFEPFEYTERN